MSTPAEEKEPSDDAAVAEVKTVGDDAPPAVAKVAEYRGLFCEVRIAVDHSLTASFISSAGVLIKTLVVESQD